MNLDDLIDGDDLSPEDELRLRRVHDLLVQAGPPPDLPPELEHPLAPTEAKVLEFPLLMRRRLAAVAVAAAAVIAVVFVGGYAFGHAKAKTASFAIERAVPMHGKAGRLAVIKIGTRDSVGNWPMLVQVTGLPQQANPRDYYELWLTQNGKPVASCGSFRVHGNTTTIRLSVPYSLEKFDGWAVTAQSAPDTELGPVVLTT